MSRPSVAPIAPTDLHRVGRFLSRNLNDRVSAEYWARVAMTPWFVDAPNHGFMLLDDDEVVGVYLAFYSSRTLGGKTERFCNLGAWCVSPQYRLYSLNLLKALLRQPGYHFTDLSPSGSTVAVNQRLNFVQLDTTTALMPNLPWPSWPGRRLVSSDHDVIERGLSEPELQVFRDHRHASAAHHVILTGAGAHCYVIYRRSRRRGLPLFATVLYVSSPPVFQVMSRQFGRHLLLRHGIPVTLMELRTVGGQPAGSILLQSARPKMFKSDYLQPDAIDDLYSELVCVEW